MSIDEYWMGRALRLAERGQGFVEPNPMVGCVIVRDGEVLGAGWHGRFGGPHAEVAALRNATELGRTDAEGRVPGATAYVTLEPCCHHGKTPPCTEALKNAGVARVVVAHPDPFAQVNGGGIAQLREAGIDVLEDVQLDASARILAPYLKRVQTNYPWVIAKWAMTLDGRIASRTLDSQWISGESSREVVHKIRGRVDAIMVGSGTANADDPSLTARPAGARLAIRVVIDSMATLSPKSKLAMTAKEIPVLLFASSNAPPTAIKQLEKQGVEIVVLPSVEPSNRIDAILMELGQRQVTNVLVEGGGGLLGEFHDAQQIDEWHLFIAPMIIGGSKAVSPVRGDGLLHMSDATHLVDVKHQVLGNDVYVIGRTAR